MCSAWTSKRIGLVVNTSSRTGQAAYLQATRSLSELGLRLHTARPLNHPERLQDTLRELQDDDCDLIILGGGDGTVSFAVDVLAHRRTTLGLLPLGTANDFARTLDIPTELAAACETIAYGKVAEVDLGLAGDNYYANLASVGLATGVTQALTHRLKKYTGMLAYPMATAKALTTHQPFSARLSFPGGDHETLELDELLQVGIGNGRFYGGGSVVAPDAGIDDKSLDVYTITMGRRRDLVKVAYRFKSGAFVHSRAARHYRTERLRLETDPQLTINMDGELEHTTPETFSVVHDALRVIVPADSAVAN